MPRFNSSRRRLFTAIGVLVLAATLTTLVTVRILEGGPRLVSRTNGSAAGAVSAPGPDRYYAAAVGQVCLSDAGPARIRSIEPIDPHGGIAVTDFSVVPTGRDAPGASDGRLRAEPAYEGSSLVTDICTRGAAAGELHIEVFKPRAEDAWAREYRINYDIDGETDSERIRFSFGVCEADLDSCDHDHWRPAHFPPIRKHSRIDNLGQSLLAALSFATAVVALAGLARFRRTDWYAWQRTKPPVHHGTPIGQLVTIGVIVGILGAVAVPADGGLKVDISVAGR